uniref:ARAD1C39028p n=1 Tax=Blastobotrys adeninivorans TaxID=409370 RepID=A0A060T8S2_BLAAD
MDQSELVAQFCAITSAEPSLAEQYLAVNDNNLEQAVALFFESGGASLESQVHDPTSANPQSTQSPLQEDPVRERIQPVTERLVNPGEDYAMGRVHQRGQIGIFNQRAPANVFRDDSDDEMDNDEELELLRETVGQSELTPHQSRLANLFRPPFDIMKNVSFERAKDIAQVEKKWVMVNIQDNKEFACQQLNRDLWSDKDIKDVVRENFIFVQYANDSPAGEMYCGYYPFSDYPHISILDPRTGEQVKVWSKVPATMEFLQEVHEFLANFSLEPGHRNPVADIPKHKQDFNHMTEDEQIDFVVRQSLNEHQQSNDQIDSDSDLYMYSAGEDDDEDDIEIIDHGPQGTSTAASGSTGAQTEKEAGNTHQPTDVLPAAENEELTEQDIFASILPESIPEPPADPKTTTRVQIRLGSGKRIVRRLNLDDKVRVIFSIVKNDVPEVKGEYFTLTSERRNLISLLDQTVEEANLKNSSIMVEIHDE